MIHYPTGIKKQPVQDVKSQSTIHIHIPGKPIPMSRPRVTRHFNRRRRRWIPVTFNLRKMVMFEHYARLCGMKQYHGNPIKNKPLSVTLLFYRQIPKSWSNQKKYRADWHYRNKVNSRINGKRIWPITKPDIDNYCKSAIDSQNKVIWYDDNLICHINEWEFYSFHPRIELYCHIIPKEFKPEKQLKLVK